MFSRPKILFLVSLLFVALLNPKFNPYLLFKFLIFYHSSMLYHEDTTAKVFASFVCEIFNFFATSKKILIELFSDIQCIVCYYVPVQIIVFCMGEIKEKIVLYFPYYSKCAVWKIQYSDWQIQYDGQSRGVKNLIKEGITIDHVNNVSLNNSNVVLDIIRYFSSLLAALFYSTHLLEP